MVDKIGMIQGTFWKDVRPNKRSPRGARMAPNIPGTSRASGGARPPFALAISRYFLLGHQKDSKQDD